MNKVDCSHSRRPVVEIFYILLICFASHWMLLIGDGFFWDDNLLYVLLNGKHYGELKEWMLEMGLPFNYVFFRVYDFLFNVESHRLVSFFSIFLSAVFLNDLFRHFAGRFGRISLVFVSLYLTLYPFRTSVLLSTLHYQVMLLCFLVAIWTRVRYGASSSFWVHTSSAVAFTILSVFSFGAASILVLFYFYFVFEYFHSHNFCLSAFSIKNIRHYLRRNWLFLLLPLGYWLVKNYFFSTYGLYAGYNKINLDLQRAFNTGLYFFLGIFKSGIVYNVVSRAPIVLPGLILFFFASILLLRNATWWTLKLPIVSVNKLVAFGWAIAFLFISMLPYMVVPTSPRFQGWESRHYLLFTISLPIFVLVVLVLYLEQLREGVSNTIATVIARPIIISIAFLGVVASSNVYLDLQSISIKQWAVVENLKARPELKKYSNFWIDDRVGDFSKGGFRWYEATHQNWYEWAAVFSKAWGEQKWYGNNIDENQAYHVKMLRYGAADINPDGDVCYLLLNNVATSDQFVVIRDYWRIKYFGTDTQLREYLLSVVAIESCPPTVQ